MFHVFIILDWALKLPIWVTGLFSILACGHPKVYLIFLFGWFAFFKWTTFDYWTKGVTPRGSSTPFRIVCCASLFGIYIAVNYFTATYTSFLSTPVFKTAVNSVEDLANSATVKTLLNKGSSTEELIMVSSSAVFINSFIDSHSRDSSMVSVIIGSRSKETCRSNATLSWKTNCQHVDRPRYI